MSAPDSIARYVLLGWPLEASLSPALHAAAFSAAGIRATYDLAPTAPADLPAAAARLRRGEWAGANVTIPHKSAVRSLLDEESELASALGAVNTITRVTDPGTSPGSHSPEASPRALCRLRGDNTDVAGFRHALAAADLADGAGRRAMVLGAGGGARAVVHVLLEAGYAVRVHARSAGRAAALVVAASRAHPGALLATGSLAAGDLTAASEEADLLVSTLPPGGGPPPWPWPDGVRYPRHLSLVDIVAWPLVTQLVEAALEAGARARGGLDMLVGQAAEAHALWTGRRPPIEAMYGAVASREAPGATRRSRL